MGKPCCSAKSEVSGPAQSRRYDVSRLPSAASPDMPHSQSTTQTTPASNSSATHPHPRKQLSSKTRRRPLNRTEETSYPLSF